MYKVFYNEKFLILSEKPLDGYKSLKFTSKNQFDETLTILREPSIEKINLYCSDLDELWNNFKTHFYYLEAAGGIVKNTNDELLFIYRLGKWDLPKGKVEKGETTEIAALREVEEECGISNLQLNGFIANTYHIYFDKKLCLKSTYWYDMLYEGNESLTPQTEEGIDSVEWKKQEEIPTIFPLTYENIKIILTEFKTKNL